jgi:hypothetical protein
MRKTMKKSASSTTTTAISPASSSPNATERGIPGTQDEGTLQNLGYEQQLAREWSLLHNFGVSFSIISMITGITTLMQYGLTTGGPGVVSVGWLVVCPLPRDCGDVRLAKRVASGRKMRWQVVGLVNARKKYGRLGIEEPKRRSGISECLRSSMHTKKVQLQQFEANSATYLGLLLHFLRRLGHG